MRHGFTLVELLVVIAILAILFAIGYPLFLSSLDSAHRTHTISNLRQIGSSMLMYATNHNGTLPYGFAKDGNDWRFSGQIPQPVAFPSGWTQNETYGNPDKANGDHIHWSNAVLPYTKNHSVFEAAGVTEISISGLKPNHQKEPINCSFSYNGLLHQYAIQDVVKPSKIPMVWMGFGKISIKGLASTNPYLVCNNENFKHNCVYSAGNGPSSNFSRAFIPNVPVKTYHIYGKGNPVVHIDGSAKLRKLTAETLENRIQNTLVTDKHGLLSGIRNGGTMMAPIIFRPDSDL